MVYTLIAFESVLDGWSSVATFFVVCHNNHEWKGTWRAIFACQPGVNHTITRKKEVTR